MTMETLTSMNTTTLNKLKDLLRINLDSSQGFRTAASDVSNERLKLLFRNMENQRRQFAGELAQLLELNGKVPEYQGSFAAKVHRWWIDLKAKFTDGDEHAILAEAELGEDAIKSMYEEILPEIPGNPVNNVLLEQYGQIKEGHNHMRALRDSFKE